MTPERAAAVLGVPVDATPADVEHAFQRRARATHPDLAPAEADGADASGAAAEPAAGFREATEARRVLLSARPGIVPPPTLIVHDGPRLQGPGLLAVWAGLLVVAAFLAIFRAPYPFTLAEPLVRWAVLILAAIAFARTGRRALLAVAVVAEVATVAMTVAVTTLGGLIALLITFPALLGAFTAGIVRQRWRARLGARPDDPPEARSRPTAER